MLKQTNYLRVRRILHALLVSMICLTAVFPLAVQAGSLTNPELPGDITRPFALFSFSCNGLTCTFDGRASVDADGGAIVSYRWNFGDNSTPGAGSVASRTYAAPGVYNVTLTVTDDEGEVASQTKTVTVTGPKIRVMFGTRQIFPGDTVEVGGTHVNRRLDLVFKICNDGTGPLTVTNLHVSRDSGFRLLYPNTAFTVPPGACGDIGIRLIAGTPGLYSAFLNITSNAAPTSFKFRMNGAVVP